MKTIQKAEQTWKCVEENYIKVSDSANSLIKNIKNIACRVFIEVKKKKKEEFP